MRRSWKPVSLVDDGVVVAAAPVAVGRGDGVVAAVVAAVVVVVPRRDLLFRLDGADDGRTGTIFSSLSLSFLLSLLLSFSSRLIIPLSHLVVAADDGRCLFLS